MTKEIERICVECVVTAGEVAGPLSAEEAAPYYFNKAKATAVFGDQQAQALGGATAAIGNSGGPPEEPPEPIVVDGADHWEVECVLAEQTKDRRRFVLVKWLGFDIASATWEPIANIPEQFIRQYRELVHQ